MLTVRLTRLSPTHHRMSHVRSDGSGETVELETRSTLRHDLLHFALETEAGLEESFFGLLAKGATMAALAGKGMEAFAPGAEIGMTERIVGPMSGVAYGNVEIPAFLDSVRSFLAAQGERPPEWLTPDLVARVKERYRRLFGQWKATAFGDTMELKFAPRPERSRSVETGGGAS
jgi:hypothetical protein